MHTFVNGMKFMRIESISSSKGKREEAQVGFEAFCPSTRQHHNRVVCFGALIYGHVTQHGGSRKSRLSTWIHFRFHSTIRDAGRLHLVLSNLIIDRPLSGRQAQQNEAQTAYCCIFLC